MVSNIQDQFAKAFNHHPPVQVVVPPQQPPVEGGSTWKWISIFLIGVLLVGIVVVFTHKSAPKGKRIRDVLEAEAIGNQTKKRKKKKVTFDIIPEEEEEEEEESELPPELLSDPKFTSMAEIVRQKQQGKI